MTLIGPRRFSSRFPLDVFVFARDGCGKTQTNGDDEFFAELRRRNVYKIAVAYAIVAGSWFKLPRRFSHFGWSKVDPLLDPLRGERRFEALVQKSLVQNNEDRRLLRRTKATQSLHSYGGVDRKPDFWESG
jgi:hypothetical protein